LKPNKGSGLGMVGESHKTSTSTKIQAVDEQNKCKKVIINQKIYQQINQHLNQHINQYVK